MKTLLLATFLALATSSAHADPQLTSWFTELSSKYARSYLTDADATAGTTYTTWSNPSGNLSQVLPAYAGIQQISYSSGWIYIKTSDLGGYTMGPWYDNAARTTRFVNAPKNQNIIWRLPRTSTLAAPPVSKTTTSGMEGAVGFLIDGVAMFDCTDGFSYVGSADTGGNTGQWHRDAYVNEGLTTDYGNTHQQNTGMYHNHANPLALRYLMGDNITFNPTTKKYTETPGVPTKHSPLLGWMRDGYPIYGPYGYSSALNANNGIRRMVSGFVKRDGTTIGVDNVASTGRTLPAWALRNNGNTSSNGPAVSTTFPFGRYIQDNAYLGDLIKTGTTKYEQGADFDLNEYNVRYCVTPEFPSGTYAYFMTIDASGTPAFPYHCNRYFFGTPTATTITTISETVTDYFKGGPDIQEAAEVSEVNKVSGNVTLTWSSVEGGTYQVLASDDLSNWTPLTNTQAAASGTVETSYVENAAASSHTKRFYKVGRTALATYDGGGGSGGTTPTHSGIATLSPTSGTLTIPVTLTITLDNSGGMNPPPVTVQPTSVTLTKTGTTLTATSYSRNTTTGVVTATVPLTATGTYTVNATFGPNTWSLGNGFTVN
ncbi:MAG: YHYH protein [Luteolibacter sp.]|uniref:YHYH protein n=1 Tax=Luteolibacter sp. TaxID=1962973 RepID=UPI00326477DF